jgi:putative membrane protein
MGHFNFARTRKISENKRFDKKFVTNAVARWTPLLVITVCYTFFDLDALGDELEDPFGQEVNDLPLDAMVRVVERELLDALGRTDLPPLLEPVDHLLT